MSVAELAARTGLAVNTIRKAESTNHVPTITPANMRLIRSTFEAAGVHFINASELGPGVRLNNCEPLPIAQRRRSGSGPPKV